MPTRPDWVSILLNMGFCIDSRDTRRRFMAAESVGAICNELSSPWRICEEASGAASADSESLANCAASPIFLFFRCEWLLAERY
jgi:hypothetical protein